jgi:hypothetical protein
MNKKKIGTVLDPEIFDKAKQRAVREHRPLSDLIQEALVVFLHGGGPRADAERSCRLFCSHGSRLDLDEISELLEEDVLAI